MAKWRVLLTREEVHQSLIEIEVEADNEMDAEDLAREGAYDGQYDAEFGPVNPGTSYERVIARAFPLSPRR